MKYGISIVAVAALMLAVAAPAMAAEWDNGGTDILWSNPLNWDGDAVPGSEKTVVGELNYPSPSENTVTLNTVTSDLEVFEIYGGGILNIETGGVLNVIDAGDAEFKIYTGGNGAGDVGTEINLLGGSIVVQDGVTIQLGDDGPGSDGLYGSNGSNVEGIGYTKVSAGGYTTYTDIPEPATMSLMAIGGLALIRRRKRA